MVWFWNVFHWLKFQTPAPWLFSCLGKLWDHSLGTGLWKLWPGSWFWSHSALWSTMTPASATCKLPPRSPCLDYHHEFEHLKTISQINLYSITLFLSGILVREEQKQQIRKGLHCFCSYAFKISDIRQSPPKLQSYLSLIVFSCNPKMLSLKYPQELCLFS